jgi:GntR family transcriptional repressor for pyruvate dehydrogenase complex
VTETREIRVQAVRRVRLTEEIVDQIERLILSNELRVGDALPSERELAVQLKVSRNILREALSVLVQKGLLEVRPGSGTYVARPGTDFLRDSLDFILRLNGSVLHSLIEARYALEVYIADLAARRATEEDCAFIRRCLQEMEASSGEAESYVEADVRFHAALAEAAKNEILRLLLDSIRGALRENIRVLLQHQPKAVQEAMVFHRRIAQAVQDHSPEAASQAMREHLESVRQGLQRLDAQGYRAAPDSHDERPERIPT